MSRRIANQVYNNFTKGLITEANVLNFPEKACTATDNCVFTTNGDINRRFGMDFEQGYTAKTNSRGGVVVNTYYWMNAAGLADRNYLVVQIGGNIYFYRITDTGAVSAGANASIVDFSLLATGDPALCRTSECQFSSGNGYLFGANPYSEPFYISYNSSTDSFSATLITVTVRDTEGLPTNTLTYDNRPSTLTNDHKYNLYNQGWAPILTTDSTVVKVDLLNTYRGGALSNIMAGTTGTARTEYPSDADVWWLFKTSANLFNRDLADSNIRGNTPAPKGHYIFNAFNIDRSTVSGITSLTTESSSGIRPKAVAFYSSRVWFAGTEAQGFGNKIYFSQVAKSPQKFGLCYQVNDPTNEYLFDLLDTDGGVVQVPDMGTVYKMVPVQSSLLIFASNGVWAISGNQGIGFSAGDYSIRKVSSIPSVSATSFVDVEGFPIWWNYDGIYMVTGANSVGTIQIDNLVETTIKTFYTEDIPTTAKTLARGSYNPLTRQVLWLYRSYSSTDTTSSYEFNAALVFNTFTKAFYPWSFPNHTVTIQAVSAVRAQGSRKVDVPSVDSEGQPVVDTHLEPVVNRTNVVGPTASVFKFFVTYPNGSDYWGTFAECYKDTYVDFYTIDNTGLDYKSYAVAGYETGSKSESALSSGAGKGNHKFQNNYVNVYFKNRDTAAFDVQGVFNTATSVTSGYYGQKQRVASDSSKKDYVYRKIKCRGNGTVIQIKFSSVTGKPFEIAGWTVFETFNASV